MSERGVFAGIAAVSAAVLSFLVWLLYLRPAGGGSDSLQWVPACNAAMNAASAAFLLGGFLAIRNGARSLHPVLMLCALLLSACFLAGYVVYHLDHGDTHFAGEGAIRPAYFFVLISHVTATMAALPMILTTLYYAAAGRPADHGRLARRTLPLWLYVSVTGLLIFVMLRVWA